LQPDLVGLLLPAIGGGFIPATDEIHIDGRGEQTSINLAMVLGVEDVGRHLDGAWAQMRFFRENARKRRKWVRSRGATPLRPRKNRQR
jgi:hypothetical protein